MNEALEKLNRALPENAEATFLDCCGSSRWARVMTDARPFASVDVLIEKAEEIWRGLEKKDWLEAFAAHPKIGERAKPQTASQFARWSHGEQAGARGASDEMSAQLAEANRLYESKFGYIFIVCATGKTAEEMLEICRERIANGAGEEIFAAADEQRKITEIRLRKLID